MITTISRWATGSTRRMLIALLCTLPVLAVIGGGVEDRLSVGGFFDPDAESTRAADLLEDRFGTGPYNYVLVLRPHDEWVYSESNVPEGERITEALEAEPGVLQVASFYNVPEPAPPTLSPLRDGKGQHALIAMRLSGTEDEQRHTAERLHSYTDPNDRFDIVATGAVEVSRAAAEQAETDLAAAELLAAPFTLLGLLLVFRGIRAAIIPLIVAVFAVLGSFVALTLAVQFTDISIFARTLVTALGLGLAIDYSLLLVARFREERGLGRPVDLAISRTLQTAGRTVLFSAATVGSSLVGLLVFPVLYLRSFAFAGVAVVATASFASLLVVPPFLALFGERLGARAPDDDSFWGHQARRVMKRPALWAIGSIAVLLILGIPFRSFEPGRVDDRVLPPDSEARVGADLIRDNLSWPDANPITVVAPEGDAADKDAIFAFSKEILAIEGAIRYDSVLGYTRLDSSAAPNWVNEHFAPTDEGDSGTWFNVVTWIQPEDERTDDLVRSIREIESPFGDLLVGGNNAAVMDTVDSVTSRVPLALAVIAVVTLLLLFFMTGSIVVPIKALALNLLSLTATFGALVYIFQQGHFADTLGITPTGKLDVFTPILMFCVAFGLSMDYEVFLLARIKEEYDITGDNELAVARGIGQTGRIVTAAAVLLAIVFLAISTSQVAIVKMFGIGLAIAILTDAFLVRATLTPALMKMAGRNNWWAPAPLRRFHLRWGVWETDPVIVPTAHEPKDVPLSGVDSREEFPHDDAAKGGPSAPTTEPSTFERTK